MALTKITKAMMADESIDSDNYVDGSIDNAHIADDAIDSEHYADGSIDNAHIADDAIDSEHYADGSIDNAHIADDAIDSEHYAAGSIDTAHIATNQIDETLMKDAFVGDFTDATVTASDYFLHGDATDSGNTKKDTVQGILDLVPAGGGGKVLQVIQTPFTGVGSSSAAHSTFSSNIFSASITPSATSSKVLVFVSLNLSIGSSTYNCGARLVRGTTAIGSTADSPGSRMAVFGGGRIDSNYSMEHYTINYLDSPSTTSATTYGIQITNQAGGATTYVNRTGANNDSSDECRCVSHFTLMELDYS